MQFPRVTVYLDRDSLEISEERKEELKKIKSGYALQQFHQKYGMVFEFISSSHEMAT